MICYSSGILEQIFSMVAYNRWMKTKEKIEFFRKSIENNFRLENIIDNYYV
ncbi:unnamed protein product [Schistosoma margrebowiei]|uniref:Uncharacterized protein n=1 Tax=Schistosoma margrebowiei TaxID=48269 RepID=A0A3P7YVI8_9TREM|nr:unnamed protein product [Schistosoma margrebowiei]